MSKIEVATNGDGKTPCCGNCPFAFPEAGGEGIECHGGPPPSGIPIPRGPGIAAPGRRGEMQVVIHWPWPIVLPNQVCRLHPRFNEHPNWTSRMPQGQGARSGG